MFSFICMLSLDVYVKRLLIEKLVDQMDEKLGAKGKKGKKTAAAEEE